MNAENNRWSWKKWVLVGLVVVATIAIAFGLALSTRSNEVQESAEVSQLREQLAELKAQAAASAAEQVAAREAQEAERQSLIEARQAEREQELERLRVKNENLARRIESSQEAENEELKRLRAQQEEVKFLESNPGSVQRTTTEDSVVRRIRTAHGSFYVAHGNVEPEIEFRPAGPKGYLFPTYQSNPRRIELGYKADENRYPPPIQIPENLAATHDWVQIQDPRLAGIHGQAVIDVGNVWALAEMPSTSD